MALFINTSMRLKDIIESWSDLPGQHERQKTPEELQAEEEAELHRDFRRAENPDVANRAAQRLGALKRLKRQESESSKG